MKTVVSHTYSAQNAGDAILLSVLLQDIRSVAPSADINILTIDNVSEGEAFEGHPVLPSFMFHALNRCRLRPLKLLHTVCIVSATAAAAGWYAATGRRLPLGRTLGRLMDIYTSADIVIPAGGGYLRGKKGLSSTVELILLLHPLTLSLILSKPIVMYTQSIGPFGNQLQSWLASRVLKKVDLIIAREDISYRLLESMGVNKNVIRSVDAAFASEGGPTISLRERLGTPPGALLVGFTVRRWLAGRGQERYEQAMAELADAVIDRHHAEVVFIPQVTVEHHMDDDRITSRRVAARMRGHAHVLNDQANYRTTRGIYGDLNILIGTRFHSVIFALTSGVPALAIQYEHKTAGIMHDLGLDEWVLEMEHVNGPQLVERFEALMVHGDAYLETLRKRLPEYRQRAHQTKTSLSRVIEAGGTDRQPSRLDATPR
jgi:colanic acid/amylovoran biosynthesis protein